MGHPSLIATLLDPPSPDGAELSALPDSVEWLELRADRVGEIDHEWLRQYFGGRLIYSLRNYNAPDRRERLLRASSVYDRFELDEHDLVGRTVAEACVGDGLSNGTPAAQVRHLIEEMDPLPMRQSTSPSNLLTIVNRERVPELVKRLHEQIFERPGYANRVDQICEVG